MNENTIRIMVAFIIPDKFDPEYDGFYSNVENIRKRMENDFTVLEKHFGVMPKVKLTFHLKNDILQNDTGKVAIKIDIPVFDKCKEMHKAIVAYCRKLQLPCATIAEESVMEMLDDKKNKEV